MLYSGHYGYNYLLHGVVDTVPDGGVDDVVDDDVVLIPHSDNNPRSVWRKCFTSCDLIYS